jgi:ferric-dicitrate binding protein FerR (iron transport regulator)
MRVLAIAGLGGAFFALALFGHLAPAQADPVGLVQRVHNTAYGTPPQAARVPKHKRDGVEFQELIETARNSAVEIGFVDGSTMTIGAQAAINIDNFVFDENKATGEAVLTLTRGAFRWVTGVMPAGGIRIETPTATITVRGTNVKVSVRANGDTILGLDEGEIGIVSKGKGDPVTLTAGKSARITPDGIEVIEEVLAVADAVVDDGWLNALGVEFNRDRARSSESGGSEQ